MYGVSRITTAEDVMLISYQDVDAAFMADTLATLAEAGVVLDMISQTAAKGSRLTFSFTAPYAFFDTVIRTTGAVKDASPMISGGYCKLNLFGEEMVESVGVAARALKALAERQLEIALVTTSDFDISLLMRQEDEDVAKALLQQVFGL